MKTLNLVNLEASDIKYKISKFPDGQQNIVIDNTPDYHGEKLPGYYYLAGKSRVYAKESVQIKSRLNNWLDLELIVCTVASLRELGVEEIDLYVPYIVGARSDRKFEEGGNNYLRDVICPIINSLHFKTVTCIDPHSDVLEACVKGFRKESNFDVVTNGLAHFQIRDLNDIILISPDAGASKKIYKLAEQIGYKGDIITCSKDRDTDGKLTRTVVPILPYTDKDIIIIDDICDGGATFINIAKVVKNIEGFNGKIYLVITHGIFSKGFGELQQYFDGIYTTNSYQDLLPDTQSFVKQFNIFK
jgi:ribose-phosphate pyrophosphokinase